MARDGFNLLIQGMLNDNAHMMYNFTHLLTLVRINNYTIHYFVPIHFEDPFRAGAYPCCQRVKARICPGHITELTEKLSDLTFTPIGYAELTINLKCIALGYEINVKYQSGKRKTFKYWIHNYQILRCSTE